MKQIIINRLNNRDIKKLRIFFKKYWKKNHIFSRDNKIFNWQYKKNNIYNFITTKQNGNLIGVHGFIPLNHFDKNLNKEQIFFAFCKVVQGKYIGTMIKMQEKILKDYKPKFIGSIGLEGIHIRNYHKWQGFEVKKMNHHVIFSKDIKKFIIAKFKNLKLLKKINKDTSLIKLNSKNIKIFLKQKFYECQMPLKSNNYIINRYIKNPFYQYQVYLIVDKNIPKGLMVIRPIKINKSVVLRFVDFIGTSKNFLLTHSASTQLLKKYKAEYIDIYSYGISKKIFKRAGYIDRDEEADLIVPSHFEPFEKKNVDIFCAYKTSNNSMKIKLFKGDGDMDRPNIINYNKLKN